MRRLKGGWKKSKKNCKKVWLEGERVCTFATRFGGIENETRRDGEKERLRMRLKGRFSYKEVH
jgi:hypothetical protein